MTEQTQPTDAEIEAAWTDATGSSILPYPDDMLAFARAVLAKWGTPAGAVVPVMWAFQDSEGRWRDASHTEHSAGMKPLYPTPQPTQAQAGAPRVSPEQWQALFDDQKRLVELANSRADIAESMLKAVQAQAGADAVVEEVAKGLRRYGLTLVKTASGYDVLSLRDVAAHGIKGADHA